jgi:prepilin-type N-terminal cleavage/methylation domain-containing protein
MKKRNKKAKGMTLVEMIISIAVFAMMGGLLILVGTHIDAKNKATNEMKLKVATESPYAANGVVNYNAGKLPNKEVDITVSIAGKGDYYVAKDPLDPSKGANKKSYDNPTVVMKGDKYNAEQVYLDQKDASLRDAAKKTADGNLNLEFIQIQTTVTTTAVAVTTTTTV